MDDYSALFLDHYRRPRNLGDLEAPDGLALLHDGTCGDVLRLVVRLRQEAPPRAADRATIDVARFKAFGCAATIAVGSMVTEMITGKSLPEAVTISAADIAEALGGLPAGRLHAADLGREALRVVVERACNERRGS